MFSFVACGNTPAGNSGSGSSGGTGGSGGGGNGGATPAPTYTVTYVDGVNDAVITVPSDTNQYHEGDTVTVQFTGIGNRTNYAFSGWSDGTATYTSNGTTTFTMGTANVTLTAQWQRVYVGTKLPSAEKNVGDIVFNDGSAMPYTDFAALDETTKNTKKTYAIAVIFYKGTELNSDLLNSDGTWTSSELQPSRTLGVGLTGHNEWKRWCLGGESPANGNNINIPTIHCMLSGSAGAYTFSGDKNGSNNLEQIAAFLGEDNDTGIGENSTKTPSQAAVLYPAFWFAKNYAALEGSNIIAGSDFATGWYLPSFAEVFQLYANGIGTNKMFDINAVINALDGEEFTVSEPPMDGSRYVSSSMYLRDGESEAYQYDKARGIQFETGSWFSEYKATGDYKACAIREF